MATSTSSTATAPRSATAWRFNAIDWIALVLMIVGSINWGLVGVLNFDLVAAIFGTMTMPSRIVYALVGLAGLYGIVLAVRFSAKP